MITSLFRKSTPVNYALVVVLTTVFYFLYRIGNVTSDDPTYSLVYQIGILAFVIGTMFVANFIIKKNGLSRDSTYTTLFFLLFLIFFPAIFTKPNLILANFFVLLGLRRLISLHSLKSAKEKVFDASLWIFVATLFHFWSILFLILVFISILFHVSRDYRNWILPFLAFFASASVFLLLSFAVDTTWIGHFLNGMKTDISIDYFTNVKQNIALSVYASVALFFTASMFMTLSARPLVLQTSFKKILASFVIAIMIFVISPDKSNEVLIFTVAPLAFMATSHIELPQDRMKQEITLALLIIISFFLFFYQL